MKKNVFLLICGTIILFYSGCATVSTPVQQTEAPVTKEQQIKAQTAAQIPVVKQYKRKIAIARFSNESNYGRSLMTDQDYDRIGKQASDMLAAKLIMSNKFIVLERTDLSKIIKEQAISGDATLVGVDALIIGSVTEFGRSVAGKVGFLSSTKVQVARAKVEARLQRVMTEMTKQGAIARDNNRNGMFRVVVPSIEDTSELTGLTVDDYINRVLRNVNVHFTISTEIENIDVTLVWHDEPLTNK